MRTQNYYKLRNNPVNFGNRCYNDTSIKLKRKEI